MSITDWKIKKPKEYQEGFNIGEVDYEKGLPLPLEDAVTNKYKAFQDEYLAFQDGYIDGYLHAQQNDFKLK